MNQNQNLQGNNTQSLEETFKTFIGEIDSRQVESLENRFHDQFLDHVSVSGISEMIVSNKEKYIQSLREGKIGGIPRNIQIKSLDIIENFGIVTANLESNLMQFQTQYSFLWSDGGWKVIHALVAAKKN
jgi:hypothetical protein